MFLLSLILAISKANLGNLQIRIVLCRWMQAWSPGISILDKKYISAVMPSTFHKINTSKSNKYTSAPNTVFMP